MASPRLYPNLNEPWSDEDEAETEDSIRDDDTPMSSPLYYNDRDDEDTSPPPYEDHSNPRRHPTTSTDGVSLAEFEDYYNRSGIKEDSLFQDVGRRKNRHFSNPSSPPMFFGGGGNPAISVSCIVSRGRDTISSGATWFVGASLWKKAVVTSLLGLLCAMLIGSLRAQWATAVNKDSYLPCPSPADGNYPPCIPDAELGAAKLTVHKMRDMLHHRAAQYICNAGGSTSLTMSLEDLKQQLQGVSRNDMKNAFYLVLVNPHWNISWMDSDMKLVTDWTRYPQSSDQLSSTSPSLPLKCQLLLKLASLWRYIQWTLLVLAVGAVLYALVLLYHKKKRAQEAAVFALVGRIMDVMKYHYKKSCSKKDLLPYLAVIHVRDMLILPSERKAKEQLWRRAVDWIERHESRLRVETRRIAGQDFEVWRWIQEDPPPTEIPSSRPGSASHSHGNWHGSVFDHYPPEITTKVAPPTGTPSPCIRLKNMFEPIRRMPESQVHDLENAVLERCHPHGAVVHVWVDKKSPFGCVYLKMDSLKSAMGAYNSLHGGWYRGKLVTAKYMPESKYHKWFPHSASATTPLQRT